VRPILAVVLRGLAPSVLALLLVLSGCGGGRLSKEDYESRVCDIMIRTQSAWSTGDPAQTFADAADDLESISAPADVEDFHKTLTSENEGVFGDDGDPRRC
jgi:hypothetical protein